MVVSPGSSQVAWAASILMNIDDRARGSRRSCSYGDRPPAAEKLAISETVLLTVISAAPLFSNNQLT